MIELGSAIDVVCNLKLIVISLETFSGSRGFINTPSQIGDDFKKP